MFFDVGVLLVPFVVGLAVLLPVLDPTVLPVGVAVGAVVLLPLAVVGNVVDDTFLLVVGVVVLEVTVVVALVEGLPPVTVSVSGLNIIHMVSSQRIKC